ncbi:MAG: response regulator, partial [Verrucomicrobiales bacterium]|nr:response regulator [Verrucomicrobiales bacterium]
TVHGIVAQHNGWVEVDSTLGRGTTFRIFLPAHVPEAPLSNAAARDLAPPRGKGEHILLVEDAPRVRLATARTLRLLGYRVLEAANGAEARELWDAHSGDVDVLLTDVVMPAGTNGLDLAEELQSRKPELRVVISSGYSSDFVRAPSPARPRTTYLPKPYAAKTLATALRALLDDNR